MNSSERRSSRSIKRKRFDDEIVDYTSLSFVGRSSRPRTHSQSNTSLNLSSNTVLSAPTSPATQPPPSAVPVAATVAPSTPKLPSPVIATVAKPPSPAPQPIAVITATAPAAKIVPPKAQPVITAPAVKIELKESAPVTPVQKTQTPLIVTPVAAAAPAITSTPIVTLIKQEPLHTPSTSVIASTTPVVVASPRDPLTSYSGGGLIMPTNSSQYAGDRKMKGATAVGSRKKPNKKGGINHMSTKDLGRWKPVDDLALIIGVQQTNDLKMVHRGTKFSCKFTLNELQNRWYALLYEEAVSRIAVAAMRNLHPELVENIQSKALYTTQEEELLATIKSSESPTLDAFASLLRKHSSIFYSARTPKSLQTHWQLMKQYCLLPDQVLKVPGKDGTILSFSDNEELLNDAELAEPKDDALDSEMTLVDRRSKREIRQLETELGRWNVLVDSMTGMGFPPEFDRQTLAVLRGRLVRYLMRSREITIGRSTKDSSVDVDLGLEGPAFKVSRKQGTIKLRSNADFFLTNEGKRPIYVDGTALLTGYKTRLSHNCAIEIAGLRFTFLVNDELINAIQQESAKMNTPLT